MSSYVMYCLAQAAECARRAKLASSPQIAAERRALGLRWLRLAEKARASGRMRDPSSAGQTARLAPAR
ncbi:MAG: hypothetical protein ACJ8FA_10630 [Xanthobacteraceae bacterium]|jgi:hypothetical protein